MVLLYRRRPCGQPTPNITTHKEVLEVKKIHTIDCVVMERDRSGKNIVLGVYQGRLLMEIGACSATGGEPPVGAAIEVEYLSLTDANHLHQPRMLRLRDDKQPEQCKWQQLEGSQVNREVVTQ